MTRPACSNGHPYTEENTYYSPDGWRRCKECRRLRALRARRIQAEREGRILGTRRDEVTTYPGMKPVKAARFWALVERGTDCWLWQGSRDPDEQYGRFTGEGAHRIAYRLTKGRIPDGFEVDHLCFVPLCVNPDHLEAVTREENQRRRRAHTTACRRGHPHTPENTYYRHPDHGQRQCRVCIRLLRAQKKAAAAS